MADKEDTAPRRIWRTSGGALTAMSLVEDPLSAPTTGSVQVAVESVGLNFADLAAALGLYSATPKPPFTPGLEFAGVITRIGGLDSTEKGATFTDEATGEVMRYKIGVGEGKEVKIGDRVLGVTRFGGYTSHINSDVSFVAPLPDNWSFNEGAAFLVQMMTAWYGLITLAQMEAGHRVLIQSAAGGVGLLSLQLCFKFGAHPICTVGSERKAKFLLEMFPEQLKREQIIVRTKGSKFGEQLDKALAFIVDELTRQHAEHVKEDAGTHVLGHATAHSPRDATGSDDGLSVQPPPPSTSSSLPSSASKARGRKRGRRAGPAGQDDADDDADDDARAKRPRVDSSLISQHDTQHHDRAFLHSVASVAPHGLDVVFDAISGEYFDPAWQRVAPNGRYIIFGAADFMPSGNRPNYLTLGVKYITRPKVDPMSMTQRNVSLMGFNLIWLWDKYEYLRKIFRDMFAHEWTPPVVGHVFAYEDGYQAMKLLQSGQTIGKVVLSMHPEQEKATLDSKWLPKTS